MNLVFTILLILEEVCRGIFFLLFHFMVLIAFNYFMFYLLTVVCLIRISELSNYFV